MDTRKLQGWERELRAEAEEYLRAADDIAAIIKRREKGDTPTTPDEPVTTRPQFVPHHKRTRPAAFNPAEGYIAIAVDVLREQGKPLHIDDLTKLVGEKIGKDVSRDSVENAVWRGLSAPKWKGILWRPKRATYAVKEGA